MATADICYAHWKYVSFLFGIFILSRAYSCTSNTAQYKIIGDAVTLQFQARTADLQNPATATVSNLILSPNDDTILTVLYKNGNHVATGKCYRCTFTGNTATGDISIRLDNLQKSAGGTYKHALTSGVNVLGCITVYILGVPTKPAITADKDPSFGESVTLTCSGTSTTTPSNHGLSLIYNWRVDNVNNPSDSRYTYSANKRTLTLSNSIREDFTKQFTCTATENVTEGYTSANSDSFSLNVLYGPENLAFSPTDTTYEKEENSLLNDVTCTAVCNPTCTFTWTKIGQGSAISNTAVLSLESLASSQAGTYRCTATRSGGYPSTKDLTVNVIYGPRSMSFTPSTVSYREDENVDLPRITCNSECWGCRYSWTGPNSYSSSTSVFDLSGLTKSMAGNYRCTAMNIKLQQQTQQSKELKIEVRYGPDFVSLTPATTHYTVNEGTRLDYIKCYADCFPTCRYTWTKEGQSAAVSTTDTLLLGTVQKGFTGKYTCTAINGDKSSKRMEESVTITVRYGPFSSSTRLSPTVQTYTRNEGTVLPDIICSADCYPDCTYTWTKLRQGSSSVVKNDGILSLGSLNRDEAANYTCTSKNPEKLNSPTTSIQVEVIVRYGPDAPTISEQSPIQVTEGETAPDIICYSNCYPGCSYTWKNDTDNSRSSSDGVLSLRTVNRYMTGSYTCTASNTAAQYTQSAQKTITVIISNYTEQSFYIEGHLGQNYVTVNEHDTDIRFKCTGNSNPASTIRISFNGDVLQQQINEASLSFVRNDVTCFDAGVYICELSNNHGTQSYRNVTFFVRCSPRPHRQVQRNITSDLYVPMILSFTAIAYPEPGTKGFAWHKEVGVGWLPLLSNTDLRISSSGLQSNLTLMNVSKEDFGHYRLTITNNMGTYEQQLFLSEKGKQYTDKHNGEMEAGDFNYTALITGITLGIVCCVIAVYATYLTILNKKANSNGKRYQDGLVNQTTYANTSFAQGVSEPQNFESAIAGGDDASFQQYTELSQYANNDKDTYDVLNKI